MKRKKKNLSATRYQYFLTLATLSAWASLQANPEGLHLINGDVSSTNPSSHILEITSGKKAIIEWDSFSIANHEVTRFIQQDSSSAVLNRVTGDMSKILGTLESNGKIFLINPKGILIGEGAKIDTGSFIASTFDILNTDFLEGKELLFSGDSEHTIINLGTIQTNEGDVVLLAHRVKNDGTISAPQGQVSLQSGNEFLLKLDDSKIFIRPKLSKNSSKEIGIENTGTIQALEAHLTSDGNLFAQAINHSGVIEATGIENQGGRIRLVAENGRVVVTGDMVAKSGENGGTIHVLGKEVLVLDKASFNASGLANGGEILIGGDYQGKNPNIYNADITHVAENVTIQASSLREGNGGKVILWGNTYTGYHGNISARGGPLGGNGGFTEISSPIKLDFRSTVDLSAPKGKTGTLLLDPADLVISDIIDDSGFTFTGTGINKSVLFSSTPSTMSINTLNSQLSTSNLTIDTSATSGSLTGAGIMAINVYETSISLPCSNNLTLNADSALNMSFLGDEFSPVPLIRIIPASGSTSSTLNLNAPTIRMSGDITHTGATGDINITATSQTGFILVAQVATAVISTVGTSTINVTSPKVDLSGDALNISSPAALRTVTGDINVNSAIINLTGGNANVSSPAEFVSTSGNINLSNVTTLTMTTGKSTSPTSASCDATISTNTGNITIDFSDTISLNSGLKRSSVAEITTVDGNIQINATQATNGNLSLISTTATNNAGDSYQSFIRATGAGNIELNVNNLTITNSNPNSGSQSPQSFISSVNGDITGNLQNLTITAFGNLDSFIQTTGTGNISFVNTQDNGTYLLSGVGGGASTINTSGSGTISLEFQGADSGLSLLSQSSTARIIRTGSSSGAITITGSGTGNFLLVNGVAEVPTPLDSSIVNQFGDINLDFGSASEIRIGNAFNQSAPFIQTTTNPGNITINQTGGTLILEGGNGVSSNARIVANGEVQILGGGSAINLLGGSGTTSQAFIQSTANPTTINAASLALKGGSGDVSDAFITPITSGNVSITAAETSLTGGDSLGTSSSAFITITDAASTLEISAPSSLALVGGAGSGNNAAFISILNSSNTTPLNIEGGNLTLNGGSGSNSPVRITAAGPISITDMGSDFSSIQGGFGTISTATITTPSSITINNPNSFMNVFGGQGASSYAKIETTSSTTPAPITINTVNLSIRGSSTGQFASVATNVGDIYISPLNAGALTVSSGTSAGGYAQIFSNEGNIFIGQDSAFNSVNVYSYNDYSQIYTGLGNIEIANISGDVFHTFIVGGPGNGAFARIFTEEGDIEVGLPTGIGYLTLEGGDGSGSYAKMGTANGNNITLNYGRDTLLTAGNSPSGGNSDASITGISTSGAFNLTLNTQSLTLQGGIGTGEGSNQAFISLGNSPSGNTIDIETVTGTELIAGTGYGTTNAFIRSQSTTNSTMTIDGGHNFILQGTTTPSNASGYASITNVLGDINLTANILLSLTGGAGTTGASYASITNANGGDITITGTSDILLQGGSGANSSAYIFTSNSLGTGDISITADSLQLLGGNAPNSGNANARITPFTAGNITINTTNGTGNISLIGGSGLAGAFSHINTIDGFITINGKSLSLIGGNTSGSGSFIDSNARIFTSAPNNPITLNLIGSMYMSGAVAPDLANSDRNSALISTSSSGAASPITITCGSLDLLGSRSGTKQGIANITTNVGDISITSTGHIQLIGGTTSVSYAKIQTTEGAIDLSARTNILVEGGTGTFSEAQIFRAGTAGDITISGRSLALTGGSGSSSYAQIGADTPLAFPYSCDILFPSITGDVTVVGGSNRGFALIGHGSPLATTTGIDITGDIIFSSIAGDVYVAGGLLDPSFGQIGHVNSTSASSTLSGNITIPATGDVTVAATGTPGYALIGQGGQSNNSVDSFTSDITITGRNVFLESGGLSELTEGGYGVIGFLSPSTGSVATITSNSLTVHATQDIARRSSTHTIAPVTGIGSYVLSTYPASSVTSATITTMDLTAGQDFLFEGGYDSYAEGTNFIGTFFSSVPYGMGSTNITITAGRNFDFEEFALFGFSESYIQNCNPLNTGVPHFINIFAGNNFYSGKNNTEIVSFTSSGPFNINMSSNPQGFVEINNTITAATGMTMLAGTNFILDGLAYLTNTTANEISLVADNLNPTPPGENLAYGFTLLTGGMINNPGGGKVFIYSTDPESTFIGDGKTPSINGEVFVQHFVNSPTEQWDVYYPTIVSTPSSYTVYYKTAIPVPPPVPPKPPTPADIALQREVALEKYTANFLISQLLYPQPEMLDDYMFWSEMFSFAYDMEKQEKVRKSWGYHSSFESILKQNYLLNRKKYFNFYELLLQRDIRK